MTRSKQESIYAMETISVNFISIQMIPNAVSAYLHMLPEQNCIAFLVLTIFIVDASAGGFEQKQPVHSANLIFLELIHWFDSSLRPKLDEALRCIMTQKEYDSGERKSLLIC